jgi:hypothetical protein
VRDSATLRIAVDLDREKSRTNALLWEACVTYGWCDIRYEAKAFQRLVASGASTDALVDAILLAEGAALDHPHRSGYLEHLVDDWLFTPDGRGAPFGIAADLTDGTARDARIVAAYPSAATSTMTEP